MIISDRAREIIEYLLEASDYVTVTELAKALGVTNRTIYRQLPEVNEIMNNYQLHLEQLPKKGMQIFGSLSHIKKLSGEFDRQQPEQIYSAKDRVNLIIIKIIFAKDYIKTQALAIDLNTSAQTIRNDYSKVKEILKQNHMTFSTKKGEGVKLAGKERDKRHLCTSILLQNITPNSMFNWLRGKKEKNDPYLEQLNKWNFQKTLSVLYGYAKQMIYLKKIIISDREFQEFLLLLTIFIERHSFMAHGKNSLEIHVNLSEPEHEIYREIKRFLKDEFEIELYENERNYFYWLTNLYVGRTDYPERNESSSLLLLDLVSQMIKLIGSRIQFPFENDQNLAKNLTLHIKMALERIESGMNVSNPMNEEVYQTNPKLYEIVKKSFEEVFPNIKIPEDEIGYIAIYFIASMEYLKKASISVLVVCTSGIGSSKMLRSRLEREFAELSVDKILTLHKLGKEDIKKYDLIISTTPLELEKEEYLFVSPLLNEKEIEEVRKRIADFNRQARK